jgi:hypothetical protein
MMIYTHKRQRLGIFEEVVGTLSEITQENGFLIAEISGFEIVLPSEMEDKLFPLLGKRVGILRTDIPGKEYLVRIVTEKKYPAFDQIREASLTEPKAQREKASA